MTTNTDPTELAQAARYASAEVRAQLGRIRASIDGLYDRAEAVSEPRRRALLARCANSILAAFQVREAAAKIERTATNSVFLILTEQETVSIINTVKQHIDKLTPAYLGLSPMQTALTIGHDLQIGAKPKAKSGPSAADRQRAAKQSFDRARRSVVIRSDEEEQQAAEDQEQRCPTCNQVLPGGSETESGSDGKSSRSRVRRHKHFLVRDLSVVKRSGADAPPMVSLIASSDSPDLENDRFTVGALREMARDMKDHAAYISHKYDPLDIFGMIKVAEVVKSGDKHLLRMSIEVATANAKARNVYALIRSGVKLGASVGVLVLGGAPDKDNPKVFNIEHVRGLETSVVGLPANWEDAWVTSAKSANGVARINREIAELQNAYAT